MKNREMSKFVPDHLKTNKMFNCAVKNLSFTISYVPDQYKTQQMHDRAILKNVEKLKSVSDCYKNLE